MHSTTQLIPFTWKETRGVNFEPICRILAAPLTPCDMIIVPTVIQFTCAHIRVKKIELHFSRLLVNFNLISAIHNLKSLRQEDISFEFKSLAIY